MEEETRMTAMTLPDKESITAGIKAVNEFQQVVHQLLIEGADWGIIPGTQKPTLLKPGAEKIAKLLKLADEYELVDRQEDWQKGFFRYLIRANLNHIGTGVTVSQGLGECNSMESKYRYRWVSEDNIPEGLDKNQLTVKWTKRKDGGKFPTYRVDNEDIYSQVNTILKMAKKRALVDAALSAGRLSNVFTQDLEDIPEVAEESQEPKVQPKPVEGKICPIHNVPFELKKGRGGATWWSHKDGDKWCNESQLKAEVKETKTPEEAKIITTNPIVIDMEALKTHLQELQWTDVLKFIERTYKIKANKVREAVAQMPSEQQLAFEAEVKDRIDLK